MFYDTGCYGRVMVGGMPVEVAGNLAALPGEWLEFDPDEGAIVVRHIQPSAGPSLPMIAGELVRILAEIPPALHSRIQGGDLFVHTERALQLVRLRVEPGGALHIRWAHPEYSRARRQPYVRGAEPLADPRIQRLNGRVHFTASDAAAAVRELEAVADGYEGLYPEGECRITAEAGNGVQADLADVNLDVDLLITALLRLALPGTLNGQIEVSSFAGEAPERYARFVFEGGQTFIQRPVLWASDS
jgi:hypothetical protein